MAREWQLAVEARDLVGEGPVWEVERASLLWTDIAG